MTCWKKSPQENLPSIMTSACQSQDFSLKSKYCTLSFTLSLLPKMSHWQVLSFFLFSVSNHGIFPLSCSHKFFVDKGPHHYSVEEERCVNCVSSCWLLKSWKTSVEKKVRVGSFLNPHFSLSCPLPPSLFLIISRFPFFHFDESLLIPQRFPSRLRGSISTWKGSPVAITRLSSIFEEDWSGGCSLRNDWLCSKRESRRCRSRVVSAANRKRSRNLGILSCFLHSFLHSFFSFFVYLFLYFLHFISFRWFLFVEKCWYFGWCLKWGAKEMAWIKYLRTSHNERRALRHRCCWIDGHPSIFSPDFDAYRLRVWFPLLTTALGLKETSLFLAKENHQVFCVKRWRNMRTHWPWFWNVLVSHYHHPSHPQRPPTMRICRFVLENQVVGFLKSISRRPFCVSSQACRFFPLTWKKWTEPKSGERMRSSSNHVLPIPIGHKLTKYPSCFDFSWQGGSCLNQVPRWWRR